MNGQKEKLSVIDIEKKYSIDADYTENTYGPHNVVSWGQDNAFPILLSNCYYNSATLKSVIDGMVGYVLGDSVTISEDSAKFKERVNKKDETMEDLISKIALDYFIYGGFAIQVIYSKLASIAELYALDFSRCRRNESGTKVFYSPKKCTKFQSKYEEYDSFDLSKIDLKKGTQIFYFKGDFTRTVYPKPLWYGALRDVLTEIECSKYSLNSVARGFQAKYLIDFKEGANLTDEQKDSIEEGIKNKFCSSEVESNFMLWFGNGTKEKEVEISKIESDDTPEKFIAIKDNARANIYTSMRATPLLFGLPNVSNGFSTNEYRDSYKLFEKTVITPIRNNILRALDKILGTKGSVSIEPIKITFEE